MPGCILRYCKNTSKNVNKSAGVTFHRFLRSGHEKREAWIKFVQNERSEDTWLPSEHTYICSVHFREEDFKYTKNGRKFLKDSVVPYCLLPSCLNTRSESPLSMINVNVSDSESMFDTPRKIKLKKDLKKETDAKCLLVKKIKKIKRQNTILKKKHLKLTDIIKTLKKKFGIDSEVEKLLLEKAEVAEMYTNITHMAKNSRKKLKFSPGIRKFALTCNYYSSAAYKYVRHFFYSTLPHPRTLSKWYSSVNAEPGFTDEAFRSLKLKCESSSIPVICNLVFDEVALRKQKLFRKIKLGNVNFGNCPVEDEKEEVASQALVFMLVSLTENWKIPVGYFLAAGISAGTKSSLLNLCLVKCHDVGVIVRSITFDGCPANFHAAEKLGCDFTNAGNMKTFFPHPCTAENIFVFVDPCHVIKLIRNTIENKKVLYVNEGESIRWQLVVNLNKLQQNQGLNFANKQSPRHIHFRNQLMKVKLATQLLSMSVAKALTFCDQELKSSRFQKSASTVNFIKIMNNLFDILNSQKWHFYGYKKPIDSKNKEETLAFLEDAKKYILSLCILIKKRRIIRLPNREPRIIMQITKKKIVETQNKTGFIGAIICIESLKKMYYELVENKSIMQYISSYRISQDHLELFFGCIRRHNGNNNNPNVLQFRAAYKKILSHLELRSSFTGNCIPLDNFTTLNTSSIDVINSTSVMSRLDEEEFIVLEKELLLDSDYQAKGNCDIFADRLNNERLLTSAMKFAVGYISGYVSRQLTSQLKCEECITSLTTTKRFWHHKLIILKDMGGLCYSSEDVYEVCLKTDKFIRFLIKEKGRGLKLPEKYSHINFIVAGTLKTFVNSNLFDGLTSHALQQPGTLNHRTHLIRAIIEKYSNIRLHHEAKVDPEINSTTKRQKFTKLILFQGK